MEDQPPNATGAKVLRGVDSQYVCRAHRNGGTGERGRKGVPSAFDSGHCLEGMELKRLAGGAYWLRYVANLEGERLKMDVDSS